MIDNSGAFDPKVQTTNQGVVSSNPAGRARLQKSYEPQMRSFLCVWDVCGTFCPGARFRIRDAQHGARLFAVQDQIRLSCVSSRPTSALA